MDLELTLLDYSKPAVKYINSVFSGIVPNGEIYLLVFLTILIAYGIKAKNNWSKLSFVITSIILFGFFRYLGLG